MAFPEPVPGLVIRYSYVWWRESKWGQEEGLKDRPCAVVLAAPAAADGTQVYVLPITHLRPAVPALAIEIPLKVKRHLKLDDSPSWVVLDEINDFRWPGPDLRPIPSSRPPTIEYGHLPPRMLDDVREAFLALARARRIKRVPRT